MPGLLISRAVPRRRPGRGLSLFGSLLALGLLGMTVLAAALFFETRMLDERARLSGRQLTVLSDAAASHANGRFPDLLTAARNGPVEIGIAQLRADGSLPAGFPETGALGRGHRILVLAAGTNAVDLLVTQTVAAGDTAVPAAALLEAAGGARMGLVAPDVAARLAGPAIDVDVSAFQAAFGGAPGPGALATLRRFDHRTVFGDQLYRVAVPGFAAANRMETDLDLNGNRLANANAVEAATLTLENDLEVGGMLTVTRDLTVGRALRVSGEAEIAQGASAATARIAGAVTGGSLGVAGGVRAASLTAAGTVTAGSIGTTGAVAAGSARLGGLQSDRIVARTVTATSVSAAGATARLVRATEGVDADRAGFSTLTVGRCTGC